MRLSSISLALNRPGAVATLEQQVAALFASGEQGAWYDPSDYSTMFEDATGLTPISTVEKAVGLIFDKRKGGLTARRNMLAYTEQLDNAYWTPTDLVTAGMANVATAPDATATADKLVPSTSPAFHYIRKTGLTVANATHTVSVYAKANGYNFIGLQLSNTATFTKYFEGVFNLSGGGSIENTGRSTTYTGTRFIQDAGNGWFRCSITVNNIDANSTTLVGFVPQSTNDPTVTFAGDGTSSVLVWGAQLDRASSASTYQKIESGTGGEWTAGNHAYQTGSAARPHLRSRYNLLTYSEQLNNTSGWLYDTAGQTQVSATANQTTAPDGTSTADLVAEVAVSNNHVIYTAQSIFSAAATTYTASVYLKKGPGATAPDVMQVSFRAGGFGAGQYANFNLTGSGSVTASSGGTASIQSVGNGWFRCIWTATAGSASADTGIAIFFIDNNGSATRGPTYTGNTTSNVYAWGAQIVLGSAPLSYQRIAAAPTLSTPPTYATTSTMGGEVFRPYLWFDGADGTGDIMRTANIDFSGSDEMTVAMGTYRGNATAGVLAELSDNWNNNTGSWLLFTGTNTSGTGDGFGASARGNATAIPSHFSYTASTFAPPCYAVLTALHDISADTSVIRGNAVAGATATGDKGTGNFANLPVFFGRRGDNSLQYVGSIYGLIIRGKTSTAAEIATIESYLAQKTGVTL